MAQLTIPVGARKLFVGQESTYGTAATTAFARHIEGTLNATLSQTEIEHNAGSARLFQQFIAAHPHSPLAAPAQYWTGDSLFNTKDYAGAIAAQKRLLDTWPGSAKVPDALLNMASAMRDGGDLAGERKTLEQLVARHPASEAAEKARKRLAAKR